MTIERGNPKIKIVGKRSGEIASTLENAEILLQTMRQLRDGKGICPRGVYRFKTFEEADEWMIKMIARSSLANRSKDAQDRFFLEQLLSLQKSKTIATVHNHREERHGSCRRFLQKVRRVFHRSEKE